MAKKLGTGVATTSISARVPDAVIDALNAASEATGRPRNRIIAEALTTYVGLLRIGVMTAPDPGLADRYRSFLGVGPDE